MCSPCLLLLPLWCWFDPAPGGAKKKKKPSRKKPPPSSKIIPMAGEAGGAAGDAGDGEGGDGPPLEEDVPEEVRVPRLCTSLRAGGVVRVMQTDRSACVRLHRYLACV